MKRVLDVVLKNGLFALVVVSLIFSGLNFWQARGSSREIGGIKTDINGLKARLDVLEKPKPIVAESPQQIQVEPKEKNLELATIGKGEGIEHALIRQLADDPENFGFDGDVNNSEEVKLWAGNEAHSLAIEAGYYDQKFGGEIRVKVSDKIAYVIQKDDNGNVEVAQYVKDDNGNFPDTPQSIQKIALDYSQATFLAYGGDGSKLPSYEYFFAEGV